jgi:3-deoxy-manno-octulosonate cytidylyltransferase (CMP-KDO synthetase)
MSTAAHAIASVAEFTNPNVVKVVLQAEGLALYFSRAPIPGGATASPRASQALPDPAPLRHVGIYGYRAGFLRAFPRCRRPRWSSCEALEQLRALWHGHRIAVHVSDVAPGPGVDTPEDLERVRTLFARSLRGRVSSTQGVRAILERNRRDGRRGRASARSAERFQTIRGQTR